MVAGNCGFWLTKIRLQQTTDLQQLPDDGDDNIHQLHPSLVSGDLAHVVCQAFSL